jgi:NAD(P)H-hydrate epimerase
MLALSGTDLPVVLDADGLNFLSALQPLALPCRLIITPHPKELSRLLGLSVEEIQADRAASAERAAKKYGAVVVLKGHRTVVTDGARTFVNTTGILRLAKAGSGDALTGAIVGLAAQGLSVIDAACLGVWLHGPRARSPAWKKPHSACLLPTFPTICHAQS